MIQPFGLPATPESFKKARWDDILPLYEALAERKLDASNVELWLAEWSKLEELLAEATTLAEFAYNRNTADAEAEAAQKRFGEDIEPQADEQRVRLQKKLVDLGYVREGLELVVREFQNAIELFRVANIPIDAALSGLETQWNKVNGALVVEWQGEEMNPEGLVPFLMVPQREVREAAFKLMAKPYLDQRQELATIFDQMHSLRQQRAHNAGFANYRDYTHQALCRFDYTPDDCLRFHAAIEEVVKPAVGRLLEKRRQKLGLERLRPWDLIVDSENREALKPFENSETFITKAGKMMEQVDPVFAQYYAGMVENNLLDLDNRKGKAPGGYCDELAWRKLPIIFMNAVGVDEDVRTLLHESGHAFHSIEAGRQPLIFQRAVGAEMAEVASMSMELLASPFLSQARGGYYSEAEADRSRLALLEGILLFLPHCAAVDAWQQWAYTAKEGSDVVAREAKWLELRHRFEGDSIDWSDLESERVARWYQQSHFFTNPFYYIEYGIAQFGALQIWQESLRHPVEAVAAYRRALSLGGTVPLRQLFATAGAELIFDADGMRELVGLVEAEIESLENKALQAEMEATLY